MKQLIFGRGQLQKAGSRYGHFTTGTTFQTTAADYDAPWPVAGTFRNLRVRVLDMTLGRTMTVALQINGVDTALVVAVTDPATVGEDTTHEVVVNAGDTVRWRSAYSASTAGYAEGSICVEFEADDPAVSCYAAADAYGPSTSAVRYNAVLSYNSTWISTAPPDIVGPAGTLSRYDLLLKTPPGVGKSWTFVLIKNGVVQDGAGGTTNTTLTLSGTDVAGSWTGALSVASLDRLIIRSTPAGSPAAVGAMGIGVAFTADTDGHFHIGITRSTVPSANQYAGPAAPWGADEARISHLGGTTAITLTRLAAACLTAPGAGKSITFTTRLNEATPSPSSVVTIADTNTNAVDESGDTVPLTSSDTFDVLVTFVNAPTASSTSVCWLGISEPPCTWTLDQTTFAVAYDGQTGLVVTVDALRETCEWTAESHDAWMTIQDSPPGGSGDGTITFDVAANPVGSVRVGTLTIAGETVTVTQAAHPLYSPCPTVDLATTLCGIAEYLWWVEWANWHPGGGISYFGCIDLADPVGYFGGYKPGKGLHCSSAARAMSGLDGAYEGGYFSVTLADHDRAIRHILRTSAPWGRSARGDAVVVRLISDAGRRALAEPAVIAHGIVEGTEFGQDLSVTLRVRDGMAMAGYDGLIPLRLITAADFPDCPVDTVGKRVPIVYGTLSDAAEDHPVGLYQPIYVGMLDKAGLAHHTWLVAGHAVTGIDEGYVDGVPITWGVGWLAPGYVGYDVLEAEVYVDINDHRYTLLYAVGAEADEVAAGTKTLRINLRGVEDEADGSGDLIDSYPLQVAHALQNWIIKPLGFDLYETGLWHIPKWLSTDLGEGPCVVAADTFETLAGSPATQTGGGFVIGSGGETEDAKQVISRLALNGGFHIGLNARWQVVGYQVDLTTPTANLPLLDELLDDLTAIEIDEDAFADLHATNARYQRTRRLGSLPSLSEGSPASPIPIQEWLATDVRRDATGADEYGDIPTEFALDAVADDTWAHTVCDYWLRLRRHPPRVVRVTGPLCLYSTYDVGDAVQVRHDLLVQSTSDFSPPSDVMRGVVHRVVIDPMRGTCRLDLWDLTDTFEDGA